MRFDIEDAILGMYDSIERAREAQAVDWLQCIRQSDEGRMT